MLSVYDGEVSNPDPKIVENGQSFQCGFTKPFSGQHRMKIADLQVASAAVSQVCIWRVPNFTRYGKGIFVKFGTRRMDVDAENIFSTNNSNSSNSNLKIMENRH